MVCEFLNRLLYTVSSVLFVTLMISRNSAGNIGFESLDDELPATPKTKKRQAKRRHTHRT